MITTGEDASKAFHFSPCCPPEFKVLIAGAWLRFRETAGRDPSPEEFRDIIVGKLSSVEKEIQR